MKYTIRCLVVLLLLPLALDAFSQSPKGWKKEVRKFRKGLNADYRDPEHSPLKEEDRLQFKRHNFFPIDPDYRVRAEVLRPEQPRELVMPTVSGKKKTFVEYAWLVFSIGEHRDTLTAYRFFNPKTESLSDDLFIPFRDYTSGEESYGGGRYMDLPLPEEGAESIWLDFNYAYNPYCAYATGWNCPIPPENNYVNCEVRAGVAAWDGPVH